MLRFDLINDCITTKELGTSISFNRRVTISHVFSASIDNGGSDNNNNNNRGSGGGGSYDGGKND
ncbi:unnamed protein product [Brassica napus]|uniref:(rape) hypothetical protein n=1 Tax=Brassica napus TaxID=3708 RepID=A0A816J176_BRANA|nr:unnamed protein product [Brassica napus]